MQKHGKYKNFIPISKFDNTNKCKEKRIKMLILVLLSINIYLFPISTMRLLKNNMEGEIKDTTGTEMNNEPLDVLDILSNPSVDKFTINNNVLEIELQKGKEQEVFGMLENKNMNLTQVTYNENSVQIKVGI